ncbi:GGDEF domain-containing protein [Ensifer sp.]|jgi:diguanylate cyclase (GGDEF)-like protein|uniref:GGDEF domain-containing protein n=1 Tax=Ensifer sp. TaxID=1872086 RepID=UPI002E124336|nr:GGDEF domain-containing protein [Ensifer sp.]
MSFLPVISIIALLAMLPVLISLRASMVEGGTDFAVACAVASAATLFLMLAEWPALQLLFPVGVVSLAGACLFVLSGFHRALDVSRRMSTLLVVAAAMAVFAVLLAAFGANDLTLHALSATGIVAAFLLNIAVCSQHRRRAPGPVERLVVIALAAVGCSALLAVTMLSPAAHDAYALPLEPMTWDIACAAMRYFYLPALFLGVILMIQNRVITDLKSAIARDELTGVLSRRALLDLGQRTLNTSFARQRPASFLLLDLDYFKQINDRYGHAVGDAALGHFAGTVATCLGGRGTIGRIGGEEFGIVLPNHSEDSAFALAEEIGRTVRDTPIGRSDRPIRLTVSIGLAEAVAGDTISDVMIRADMALYDAKAEGRDRCTIAGRFQPDASTRVLAAAAAQMRAADTRIPEPQLLRETG